MKVTITSDGTRMGTHFTDAATGEAIKRVTAFRVSGDCSSPVNKAVLWMRPEKIEIETDAELIEVPIGLRMRADKIIEQFNHPAVKAAMSELLGGSKQ